MTDRDRDHALPMAPREDASDILGQPDASGRKARPGDAQAEIEGRSSARADGAVESAPKPSDRLRPAGPHADPSLVNPDATPGAGTLTPPGDHEEVDASSG